MQQNKTVFALDIGTRTVIGVVAEYNGEKLTVVDHELMEHPGRAMMDGQVEDIAQVAELIGQVKSRLEARLKAPLSKVSVAAAGRMLRTVRAKALRETAGGIKIDESFILGLEGEALEIAQEEAERESGSTAGVSGSTAGVSGKFYCVGYSIVGYEMDGARVANLLGHTVSTASVELIAAFLPYSVVEGLYAVVDMNGLEVTSLTLEPIAALNVLIPQELRLLNLALVDIGAGTSDIAICKDGAVFAYDMATIAGDELTEAVIRKYLVDFESAEQMKRALSQSEATGDIVYQDVLGLDNAVSRAELSEALSPTVEQLALEIAARAKAANGGESPAAMFLVGGGSQIVGLPELIARELELSPGKVAVGARRQLKNVIINSDDMKGPEYITPLGIALTSVTSETFNFFGVTINDRRFKLLNTSEMRMMDVLVMAGYKTSQLLGSSGRALIFTLNGQQKTIKGGLPRHAELYLNAKPASMDTMVRPGDSISLSEAQDGANASARVMDAVELHRPGSVTITDSARGGGMPPIEIALGTHVIINGKDADAQTQINARDRLETRSVRTLGDICAILKLDKAAVAFTYAGETVGMDEELMDGMLLELGVRA